MWRMAMMAGAAFVAVPAQAQVVAAYTVMAPGGGAVARVVTGADVCPVASIDGRDVPMAERVAPGTLPLRKNAAKLGADHLAVFASRVCEVAVPQGARAVRVGGQALPVVPAEVRRIVVLGDTGCRMKSADNAFQACRDAAAWPFARIARAAAAVHPDLILHVGDYEYRENACPEGNAGCAGSPFGYGEDAWRADWLEPGAPLFAAAPLVVVRGNHEECVRAGQGWWRFLDPHPLVAGADCVDAAQDFAGNHTAPYAVEIGGPGRGQGARVIVVDFSAIGNGKPLDDADKAARYAGDARAIEALATPGETNFVTNHQPFGAVLHFDGEAAQVGYASVSQAFAAADGAPAEAAGGMPPLPHVAAMIAGHVHLLQVAHEKDRAVQIVNGFSGTQEESPQAPATRADLAGVPGGERVESVETRFQQFGFGVLERQKDGSWVYSARDVDGREILHSVVPKRD